MADNKHTKVAIDKEGDSVEAAEEAAIRERRRSKTHEIPVELGEFSANYDIQGLIGEGGMSIVYKAQHKALDKPMAIKMLHAHLVRDAVQRKRFEQEAQALFLLEHANIVKMRDFGSTSTGKPYLIMDFLQGKSLAEVIKAEGPIPVQRAMRIFLQVCDALEHAHSKGIIHRDIKPSNIVLVEEPNGEETVRIVDFGIAKLHQDDINPGLTQTGDVFGSPLYMSPEQCLGYKMDHRTDMYAFGCVMYEMLSGKPPLAGETALATIHKHTSEMPKPLEVPNCDPKLRARLDEIIFKTLEKDPEKRYQSMAAVSLDLQDLLSNTGYRKGGGYYVKYSRFYGNLMKVLRAHPLRYALCFSFVVAIVSLTTYMMMHRSEGMLKPPTVMVNTLGWNWMARPVEQPPVDFMDRLRQARFLISNASGRLGDADFKVKSMRRKVAQELLKYGSWDEAIDNLKAARIGYGPEEPVVADIDNMIGDCYLEKSEWENALPYFEDAIRIYRGVGNTADDGREVSILKFAYAQFRVGKVNEAERAFNEIFNSPRTHERKGLFIKTIAACGLADCDLQTAISNPKRDKSDLFAEALHYYETASTTWPQYSKHDAQICLLRQADVAIVQNNWSEASKLYDDALKQPDVFDDDEIAEIERNYARVMLRTGNVSGALHMDDEADIAAKRARTNEQNKRRLVPNNNFFR